GLAALLASIAIAATAGGEAGMAALATTQAASIDAQLRFSRANEQEADRIGMQTLVRADMNPAAMADFFEALQRSMRYYGDLPPEFLLTHPVTESRITDARARAAQLPAKPSSDSLEFHLMKMRVEVEFTRDASAKISDLENQKQESTSFLEVTEYGLSCAYLKTNQLDKALQSIDRLLSRRPTRITYIASKAEILNKAGQYDTALRLLEKGLDFSPGNYPLSVLYADALTLDNQTDKAITVLREQLTQWEAQPLLWFMLAEAHGKAGNRLGVYQSKAEYFYLYGQTTKAIEQLQYALPLARDDFHVTARISDRIAEMQHSMRDLEI
ncbi:MAG TPA: peptidase M48, partial [Gammaproteobacteria bacterium]|nr:peptidase M48 [Gammaproteobacteria bacterium]